jgi:hypothetical protein
LSRGRLVGITIKLWINAARHAKQVLESDRFTFPMVRQTRAQSSRSIKSHFGKVLGIQHGCYIVLDVELSLFVELINGDGSIQFTVGGNRKIDVFVHLDLTGNVRVAKGLDGSGAIGIGHGSNAIHKLKWIIHIVPPSMKGEDPVKWIRDVDCTEETTIKKKE